LKLSLIARYLFCSGEANETYNLDLILLLRDRFSLCCSR
jgi:hypothetical protein